MYGRAAAVASLALLTSASGALADVPRTETHTYVVGGGPVATVCGDVTFFTRTTDVGGACFLLDGSEDRAHWTVDDRADWEVRGLWTVKLLGFIAGSGPWCGETDVDIPTLDGARLFVNVYAVGGGCQGQAGAGPGTQGTVTVSFS